jgi:uncharacterized protein
VVILNRKFNVEAINVVLKLSEICNLACTYCYYYEADADQEWRSRPQFIDENVIVALTRRVKIVFHGGEPTLLAPVVVDFICKHMQVKLGHLVDLSFCIQTNGFFLSKAWMDTIQKNRIEVGISIDGKPAVHDKFRITQSGKPTSAGIKTTIQKLKHFLPSGEKIPVGVIAVVDENTDIFDVIDYFENSLQVDGVNFLLRYPTDDASRNDGGNFGRFGKILCDIFDASLLHKGVFSHELQTLVEAIRGRPRYSHTQSGDTIAYPAIALSVHTDGSFGIDDSLITVGAWYKSLKKFNVLSSSISDLLCDEATIAYHDAYYSVPDDCKACKFASACAGGIPHFRYTEAKGFNNRSVYCQSYLEFYNHVTESLIEAGYPSARMWAALSAN